MYRENETVVEEVELCRGGATGAGLSGGGLGSLKGGRWRLVQVEGGVAGLGLARSRSMIILFEIGGWFLYHQVHR
ncbi:hypothetical protein TIFTF001_017110 [Ficus carica]|uniref:Uncharacterized protein n=1 Tax=Ficus carica TaxID=3494 RepID=A0AA88D7Y7_FICCA|nr:hypothetical protein TIFTF001_017110 [Ficus carica]